MKYEVNGLFNKVIYSLKIPQLILILFSMNLGYSQVKPKPIHTFGFSTGAVLHNGIWRFKDAAHRNYLPGWDNGDKSYSIMEIKNYRFNYGISALCNYGVEFKHVNYELGIRVANYRFNQWAMVRATENHIPTTFGPTSIVLNRYGLSPVLGIGTKLQLSKKLSYYPKLKIAYNALFFDGKNRVVFYDSSFSKIGNTEIPYWDYNSFSLDIGEINIHNGIAYKLTEKLEATAAADVWIGNNLRRREAHYKYVGVNVGLKIRLW